MGEVVSVGSKGEIVPIHIVEVAAHLEGEIVFDGECDHFIFFTHGAFRNTCKGVEFGRYFGLDGRGCGIWIAGEDGESLRGDYVSIGFDVVGDGDIFGACTVFNKEAFDEEVAIDNGCGDSVCVVAAKFVKGHIVITELGVVLDKAVAGEVVTMAYANTAVGESVGGVHLDGDGLAEWYGVAIDHGSVGKSHLSVAVVLAYGYVVAMYVEKQVDDCSTVANEVIEIATGVNVVPVKFVAHAVNTVCKV